MENYALIFSNYSGLPTYEQFMTRENALSYIMHCEEENLHSWIDEIIYEEYHSNRNLKIVNFDIIKFDKTTFPAIIKIIDNENERVKVIVDEFTSEEFNEIIDYLYKIKESVIKNKLNAINRMSKSRKEEYFGFGKKRH